MLIDEESANVLVAVNDQLYCRLIRVNVRQFFDTSVDTQQWAQPVTTVVHGISSKKCQLKIVE